MPGMVVNVAVQVGDSVVKGQKLLMLEGFVPKTIHDVAVSLSPLCEKCLKKWAQELRSH